ncbi:hypothetical protein H2199_008280 [Coniosporium tulheliwenetii]|uniref:Uncharacterized protein n=1 Tax=Coniosporium tulheliwenetii TaxID=3383036 RepID=A0ACC2YKW3_9PEZI|nr:hypothetical protein H2199_008280 [Cladosporium sp. JES 115]
MTCNITSTPVIPEPLPLYRRDPDSISIRSSAPSYVSEAPTYTSRRTSIPLVPSATYGASSLVECSSITERGPGLPPMKDIENHNYNISHWSSIHTSQQHRQYQNVARRRASKADANSILLSMTSSGVLAGPSQASSSSTTAPPREGSPPREQAEIQAVEIDITPVSPMEDPYLVGENAARKARASRIYREMCLKGDMAIRHEGKTWDFMLAQMADWEERERSWGSLGIGLSMGRGLGNWLGGWGCEGCCWKGFDAAIWG